MKNLISHVRFRMVLPLLFLAVLLTLPTTSTGSKYVWNNTIDLSLEIVVEDSIITRGGSGKNSLAIYPSVYWAQELEHMEAKATEEGLVLTVEDGYTLPESITVKIGGMTFSINTDGTEAQEGIVFVPETGLLSIAENLIQSNPGGVTVSAAASEEMAKENDCAASSQTTVANEAGQESEQIQTGGEELQEGQEQQSAPEETEQEGQEQQSAPENPALPDGSAV